MMLKQQIRRAAGRLTPTFAQSVPFSAQVTATKVWAMRCYEPVSSPYCSQYGQDRFVAQWFKMQRGGVFLDIGAHDGVSYSNTAYLERELGWTGLCVEPNPAPFQRLQRERSCQCRQVAVGNAPGITRFLQVSGYGEMLSHIIDPTTTAHDGKQATVETLSAEGRCQTREIEVPIAPIDALLREADVSHVDFVSIDTEGGEFDILKSMDWAALGVQVMAVENNDRDHQIIHFMRKRQFRLAAVLGADYVFVRS